MNDKPTPPTALRKIGQSSGDDFNKTFIRMLSSTMESVAVHNWRTSHQRGSAFDGGTGTLEAGGVFRYRHNSIEVTGNA
jgi:hypothetical protein